ncbi:type II secretion system protein GspM [Paludibacterium sp.]|uniref:type II secretion system protein GspM n=1 Tax=Paludibacterium sp. TaxID=1917523 RepID=UPI0025FF14E0|nr:type II secretion system protein GspM [Paludibacterium sp.]MBV8649711.1 type II secretion system protein M [Paludibacterium sp.]
MTGLKLAWRSMAAWLRRRGPPLLGRAMVASLAVLVFCLIWRPLALSVTEARQARAAQQAENAQMTALTRAWQALAKLPDRPAPAPAALPALVRARAEALGIDTDGWHLTQEAHGARLVGEAGFDVWLALLADLQTHHAVRVVDVQLEPAGEGRVRADAVFQG